MIRIYQPSGKQSVMGSISQTIGNLGVDGSGRPAVTCPNAVDPNAVGGMSFTDGLHMRFGFDLH